MKVIGGACCNLCTTMHPCLNSLQLDWSNCSHRDIFSTTMKIEKIVKFFAPWWPRSFQHLKPTFQAVVTHLVTLYRRNPNYTSAVLKLRPFPLPIHYTAFSSHVSLRRRPICSRPFNSQHPPTNRRALSRFCSRHGR